MIEGFEEYLRSCHHVIRAPLAYIMMKNTVVETYGDYPKYVTADNKTIASRLMHL